VSQALRSQPQGNPYLKEHHLLSVGTESIRALTQNKSNYILEGFGANEAGAEFGSGNIPGVLGTDYIWPSTSAIQTLRNAGMNIFRVPFAMERLVPGTLTSSPDATYLASLKSVCRAS